MLTFIEVEQLVIYHLIPACVICSPTAPVRYFPHNYIVPVCQTLIHISGRKAKFLLGGRCVSFQRANRERRRELLRDGLVSNNNPALTTAGDNAALL